MAIRTEPQGQIPMTDLEFIHFDHFQFSSSRRPPYTTSLSSKLRLYGKHDGKRYYDNEVSSISINDLDKYVANLEGEDQEQAIQAMGAIQTGLGILVQLNKKIKFEGVE